MNRLYIDGIEVTGDAIGLKKFTIEVSKNSTDSTVQKTLSSEVTLKGDSAKWIESRYFTDCNAFTVEVPARFYSESCGGFGVDLVLTISGMKTMPCECLVSFPLKSITDANKAYNRLSKEYFWENGYVDGAVLPKVPFCIQPSMLQYLVLLIRQALAIAFAPSGFIFKVIDTIVNAVIDAVDAITPGDIGNVDLDVIDNVFALIDNFITGAGNYAPTIIIRDAISYQCGVNDLNFSSTILNDSSSDYYEMVMFSLEGGRKGGFNDKSAATAKDVFEHNAPLLTTIGLLESLKMIFNAEYRIIGKTLFFEEIEWFQDPNNLIQILDAVDYCKNNLISATYSYNSSRACAYGDFQFSQDSQDGEGNKALRTLYKDKVEFNDPPSDAQKGVCSVIAESYAASRFMFDQESYEKKGFFDWENLIDEFRDGSQGFFGFLFGNDGYIRTNDLIVTRDMTEKYKLLILENNYDPEEALVIRKPIPDAVDEGKSKYHYYNYPLYMKEDLPEVLGENELINNFLHKLNPRTRKDTLEMEGFDIPCDCDVIQNVLENGDNGYINVHGEGRIGIPERYEITFDDSGAKIKFSDIIVVCV